MTKALPCINTQQFAAKKISKDQQTLTITIAQKAMVKYKYIKKVATT